jgi:hypothetical protein
MSVTYPGLTRLEFGQQNSLKVPIIKFHKNVSTLSRVVPFKWADGSLVTFCNYFGNISGSVTFFALNGCIVLFGTYCMHCVAYMWIECCWAFNTLGQRSGYIHCSARGARTSFMHVLLWKRGEPLNVMWFHFQMSWFLVHYLSLWQLSYVSHSLEHFFKWFNWYVFVSDCMQF